MVAVRPPQQSSVLSRANIPRQLGSVPEPKRVVGGRRIMSSRFGVGIAAWLGFVCTRGLGQVPAYEGFAYPPGQTTGAQLDGGSGWAGPWSGTTPFLIDAATMSSPSALPATGGTMRLRVNDPIATMSRRLAAPFPASAEVWMSLLMRRDDLPSAFIASIGGPLGPGFGASKSGVSIFSGGHVFLSIPNNIPRLMPSLMLARFAPEANGNRHVDLWINPPPASLGSPALSGTVPAPLLDQVYLQPYNATSIDELRIVSDVAQVFVPVPGSGWGVGAVVLLLGTRRRAGVLAQPTRIT